MTLMSRTVAMHKKSLKKLIDMSEVNIVIHMPIPAQSSGVNPLFGDMNRETNVTGPTKGPFNCLWYDAYSARTIGAGDTGGIERIIESSPGQFREATAFAEVWMLDILLDQNNPSGQTWFDKALYVTSLGAKYKVLGYVKLGLSVSTPYSVIVALKGGVGYDN